MANLGITSKSNKSTIDPLEPFAGDRQEGYRARLAIARTPMTFPAEIADFLKGKGGDYALARLRHEFELTDDLGAQTDLLSEQLVKLGESAQELQIRLSRELQFRDSGNPPQPQSTTEAVNNLRAEIAGEENPKPFAQLAPVPTDKTQIARIESELAENQDRAAKLTARRSAYAARERSLRERYNRNIRFVRASMSGGSIRFLDLPKIDKKFTLETVREQILQRQADAREIQSAPRTLLEVRAGIDACLDGQPKVSFTARMFDPTNTLQPYLPLVEDEDSIFVNFQAIEFSIHREQWRKQLYAEAEQLADDKRALSPADRATKLEKNKQLLLEAERIEEAIVWQLMQAGELVVPRADADVRAILAIQ